MTKIIRKIIPVPSSLVVRHQNVTRTHWLLVCCFMTVNCLLFGTNNRLESAQRTKTDVILEELEERAFQEAVAKVASSVVRIETVGGRAVVQEQLTSTAASTGVIISTDGYIVTSSYHFVSNPSSIIVQLADGQRHAAKRIAQDKVLMITLLKIEATRLLVPPVAKSESFAVGQWALGLGKSYSSEIPSVAVGVVSALNRVWGKAALQTDAKISPINYGGPLVNIQGEVMGVLVPLSPQQATVQAGTEWYDSGIGFAVSFERLLLRLDLMKQGTDLKPGLLGITLAGGEKLGVPAIIEQVRFGSPAEKTGLKAGDEIVEIDNQQIETTTDLKFALGPKYALDVLSIVVKRAEKTIIVEAKLVDELVPYETGFLGILPERSSNETDLKGVGVRYVYPESPAAKAGIQPSDRILQIKEKPVSSNLELAKQIRLQTANSEIELLVKQGGAEKKIKLSLTSVASAVPSKLPVALIPTVETDQAEPMKLKRGRISETLEELKHQYWAYIPEEYNPQYEYSMVVWLHPAGTPFEASLLKAWKRHCDARGIIMLAPLANEKEGWSREEQEFVKELINKTKEDYRIDARRLVVLGMQESARFTTEFAFQHRDIVSGIALFEGLLHSRPPEAEPQYSLQFFWGVGSNYSKLKQVERIKEHLLKMKYPVVLEKAESKDESNLLFSSELIERMAVWIDSLDRI